MQQQNLDPNFQMYIDYWVSQNLPKIWLHSLKYIFGAYTDTVRFAVNFGTLSNLISFKCKTTGKKFTYVETRIVLYLLRISLYTEVLDIDPYQEKHTIKSEKT